MKQLLFLAIILINSVVEARDYSIIPYRVGDKWGFCDNNKNVIIEPKYNRTYWFANMGLARVKLNGKYGYINKRDSLVIDTQFDEASDFNEAGALVTLHGKKYCLDESGTLIQVSVEDAYRCLTPLTAVAGEWISRCEHFAIDNLTGVVCKYRQNVNGTYKILSYDSIPAQYDTIYSPVWYDAYFTPLIAVKDKKYGIINEKNKIVYDFEYDTIHIAYRNIFLFKTNNKWHMRDTSSILFENISEFRYRNFKSGKYFAVKVNNKWGVIDAKGQEAVPFKYDDIILPTRHAYRREFTVKIDGKWGFLSDRADIRTKYDSMEPFNGYNYTLVTKNGKEGYIGLNGKEYFKDE